MPLAPRMKATLDLFSTVMVIAAAAVLIWTLAFRSSQSAQLTVESVKGLFIDAKHMKNVLGKGRLAIVEFSDFQCPYCRKFSTEAWPTVRKELIESGKARYVAFHYPLEQLHPYALSASQAAECAAGEHRFWDMREVLFDRAHALSPRELVQYAQRVGLEQGAFMECLGDDRTLQAVRADQDEGQRLGVTGTPTFFTGIVQSDGAIQLMERLRGSVDAEVLSRQIAALLVQGQASANTGRKYREGTSIDVSQEGGPHD